MEQFNGYHLTYLDECNKLYLHIICYQSQEMDSGTHDYYIIQFICKAWTKLQTVKNNFYSKGDSCLVEENFDI